MGDLLVFIFRRIKGIFFLDEFSQAPFGTSFVQFVFKKTIYTRHCQPNLVKLFT